MNAPLPRTRLLGAVLAIALMAAAVPATAAAPRAPAAASAQDAKPSKKELQIGRHLMMAKYLELQEHDPAAALKEYRAVLALDRKHVDATMAAARLEAASGKVAPAAKRLKRLAKDNPTNSAIWRELAEMQRQAGDLGAALEAYRKAVEVNPKDVEALSKVARLLSSRYAGGDTSVKAELTTALQAYLAAAKGRRDPDSRHAERLLAELTGGELARVIYDARSAYDDAWNDPSFSSINRGMAKARAGFERCVQLQPDNALCHYYLGLVFSSVKASDQYDLAKARAELEKAPALADAHVELAVIARKEADDARAKKELLAALNLDRNNQRAWVELGIAQKLDGADTEAIESFTQAVRIDSASSLAAKAIGEINILDPHNQLVQQRLRFGNVEGDVFSSEKFKSAVAAFERRFGGVDLDAPEQRVLEGMLERILDVADVETRYTFRIAVLNTLDVNAFALPNGNIYFTKGFFQFMKKTLPDRPIDIDHAPMAHVLAHEIVHVLRQHVVRSQVFQQAVGDASSSLDSSVLVHMTRIHEIEADREGMVLAAMAGYHPRGGIEFMEARGKAGEIPPHLDHPTYDERIQYLEEYWSNDVKYAWMSFSFGLTHMDEARRAEHTDLAKAEALYREAVEDFTRFNQTLKPTPETLNDLGIAYAKIGIYRMVGPDNPLHTWNTSFSVERTLALKYVSIRETTEDSKKRKRRGAPAEAAPFIPRELHQAVKQFKAALDRSPKYDKARVNLTLCYLAIRKIEEASQELATLESSPTYDKGELANLRGVVRAEAGAGSDAMSAFADAQSSPGSKSAATFNLARLQERDGKKKDAKKSYEAFLKLEQTGPWAEAAKLALARL
ncbi:MAG: tetratricopeptide repeat protein [Deltaproteobacteria bacterium]|nr:tetratricopeptide repeat protein [Deltaproteobacteria bacterium]MCB9788217.1 tetratricopeptide repeat protein [Deltaproteobacteria bacterium]